MQRILFVSLFAVLLLAACRQQEAAEGTAALPPTAELAPTPSPDEPATATPTAVPDPTATPDPTPTPSPTATPTPMVKELTVCVAAEPADLFLYGDSSLTAVAVRHGLYENLYTSLGYAYQPQGLAQLPSLENGGVRLETVDVRQNDLVQDAQGVVRRLVRGVEVRTTDGELVRYSEGVLQLPQMVVDFSLQPMVWSDGTPVTADDSVFSFELASNPLAPGSKTKIERTAVYEATGDLTVQWRGIPGFVDANFATSVWTPLPRHQLGGLAFADLAAAPEAGRTPLSSGPFVVADWSPGEYIRLEPNPFYYRADEGLPHLEAVLFKLNTALAEDLAAADGCHLVAQDVIGPGDLAAVLAADAAGQTVAHVVDSPIFEHVAFGIESIDEYARTRPDWFGATEVRQALTMCIDRQRMADELFSGYAQVIDAYVPADHPLYPVDVTAWPFDPSQANRLLDELGYVDTDGDGWREEPETAVPFRFRLSADAVSPLRGEVVAMIQEDLAACGIDVELDFRQPAEFYGDGPLGSLFGRRYDLGALAWRSSVQPPCHLWLSDNITGPEAEGFGGWSNINPTGWRNEAYDAACRLALRSLPGTSDHATAHQEALRIFSQELPGIPLFTLLKVAAVQPELQNFRMDSTQLSELWNLYELDLLPAGSAP